MIMRVGHGKALALLVVFVFLHAVVLAAGFVSPCDPLRQDRDRAYAPPTAIHFIDAAGRLHLRPFIYVQHVTGGTFDQYEEDRSNPIPLRFFVSGSSYRLLSVISANVHLFGAEGADIHLLGK